MSHAFARYKADAASTTPIRAAQQFTASRKTFGKYSLSANGLLPYVCLNDTI